ADCATPAPAARPADVAAPARASADLPAPAPVAPYPDPVQPEDDVQAEIPVRYADSLRAPEPLPVTSAAARAVRPSARPAPPIAPVPAPWSQAGRAMIACAVRAGVPDHAARVIAD